MLIHKIYWLAQSVLLQWANNEKDETSQTSERFEFRRISTNLQMMLLPDPIVDIKRHFGNLACKEIHQFNYM